MTLLEKAKINREKALNYLGGKCARCGSTEKLQFDHVDPTSVTFRVGRYFQVNWDRLVKELNKCQLLCNDCHWEKTRRERGFDEPAHGTLNMYSNKKCRCSLCKSAWSIYRSAYRRRKKLSQTLAN